MSGDEHALSAAELETKVRDRRQLMGSAPSEVPGTISTAQLRFFFSFFSPTLMFHAHLLEQNRFISKAGLDRFANTILAYKFRGPSGFVLFFLLTKSHMPLSLSTSVTCIHALLLDM